MPPLVNAGLARHLDNLDTSHTKPGLFALGLGSVFLIEVSRKVAFLSLFPATPEEAQEWRRQKLRGGLIVGGLFFALVALAALAFAILALIGWAIAHFLG